MATIDRSIQPFSPLAQQQQGAAQLSAMASARQAQEPERGVDVVQEVPQASLICGLCGIGMLGHWTAEGQWIPCADLARWQGR